MEQVNVAFPSDKIINSYLKQEKVCVLKVNVPEISGQDFQGYALFHFFQTTLKASLGKPADIFGHRPAQRPPPFLVYSLYFLQYVETDLIIPLKRMLKPTFTFLRLRVKVRQGHWGCSTSYHPTHCLGRRGRYTDDGVSSVRVFQGMHYL